MKSEIQAAVQSVINPATGKSLYSEGRIVDIKNTETELVVKYKRDGISPEQKKVIESDIVIKLKDFYKPEQISVLTISEDSKDVFGSVGAKFTAPKKEAELKVGHGPAMPQKKRVNGVKKVFAVSSCKGGVGKSTVAVNLAFSLKNLGKKVGLLDADIYGPSVPMLLNQRDAKPTANDNKKILPVEAYGLPFMSFGLFIGESDPVIWRGPMLGGVLNQFLFDVDWGELDYLIIDLPPGTGDMQLSMVQATDVDGALVVSTPQDVALLDTKKGIGMFNQVKVPILGMIENMSYFVPDDMPNKKYFIFGEGGVIKASEALGVNYLGGIPMEIALRESSDTGNPYMNNKNFEGREVWKAYMEIAKRIDQSLFSGNNESKGFFKKLFS